MNLCVQYAKVLCIFIYWQWTLLSNVMNAVRVRQEQLCDLFFLNRLHGTQNADQTLNQIIVGMKVAGQIFKKCMLGMKFDHTIHNLGRVDFIQVCHPTPRARDTSITIRGKHIS